jgi:hypothetical protein
MSRWVAHKGKSTHNISNKSSTYAVLWRTVLCCTCELHLHASELGPPSDVRVLRAHAGWRGLPPERCMERAKERAEARTKARTKGMAVATCVDRCDELG